MLDSCMHCCAAKCARLVKCIFMIVLNLNCYWSSGVNADIYHLFSLVNPKRAGGGGGGGRNPPPPPLDVFFAPQAFMTIFFEVLRNFCRYFWKNRAYGSKVTQHYVIERRPKI